jgi:fatty acid desaturase
MESTIPEPRIGESEMPGWISRSAFPILTACLFAAQALFAVAIHHGWLWAAVLFVPVIAHLMHGQLIGLHEASHSLLRKSRWLNDLDGFLIAAFSFMSFTLYRASHQTHHMHLSTERDEELWPFVDPGVPRWRRVLAAVLELTLGIVYTPFLFLRTFLRKGSPIRAPRVRRRIWREFALVAVLWAVVLGAVGWFGVWEYFLWLYLVPAILAGNLQSLRKFIEHVGMTGNTPNSATRSIVCETWGGKFVSFTLLHEPYHGVHHEISGIPHPELPRHAAVLEPKAPGDVPPFPSYRHAFRHLLGSLVDPRVGGQWQRAT